MANLFGASGLVGAGLRAGQKIQRVDVIADVWTDRPDGGGDVVPTVVLADLPCILTPLSVEERAQGVGALFSGATHELRCDYTPLITTTAKFDLKVPDGGPTRRLEALGVFNVNERYRELQVITAERVA